MRVRETVQAASEHYRDADIAEDQKERAHRQFTLIQRCYLQRQPQHEVAAALGISMRQFYRERADACQRIAQFMQAQESNPALVRVHVLSEIAFTMDSAAASAEAGDYERAIGIYSDVAQNANFVQQKIEALCRRAELELDLGSYDRVQITLSVAAALLAEGREKLPPLLEQVSQAHVSLVVAKLAWMKGEAALNHRSLEAARAAGEKVDGQAGPRAKGLYVDVLLECANTADLNGDHASAQQWLDGAHKTLNEIGHSSLHRRIDWMILQARLGLTLLRPGNYATIRQQLALLNEAFDMARGCGSLKRMIDAEIPLSLYCVQKVQEAERLANARRLMSLARQLKNRRLMASVSLDLADYLSATGYWIEGLRLLHHAESVVQAGSIPWAFFMNFKARYHMKAGDARAAYECEKAASECAQRLSNHRLLATTLRELASAAHHLGKDAEAMEYVTAAIPIAETHGTLVSCLRTYRCAAAITGKAKYERAAESFARALGGY